MLVVDPTVSALAAEAGEAVQASVLELPAATTTLMPSATARSTASLRPWAVPPPRLMLSTAGPLTWSAMAQSMPAMTPDMVPEPLQSRTRTATSDTPLATP